MAGLQGVGKTTQCGKLANSLTKANKKVSCLLAGPPLHRALHGICLHAFSKSWSGHGMLMARTRCTGCSRCTACTHSAAEASKSKPCQVIATPQVLMVATDVYRPAAIEQLHKLGERAGVPVYDQGKEASPVDVARRGVAKARDEGFDAVIIDTAGRLQASCFCLTPHQALAGGLSRCQCWEAEARGMHVT